MSLRTFFESWFAAGALGCAIVFFLWRRTRDDELKPSPVVIAVTLAAGPIIPAALAWFAVAGTGKRRQSKAHAPNDGPIRTREDLLCRMINLRLAVRPEPGRPHIADHWIGWQLGQTPEADLAAAIDMFLWNEDAVRPLGDNPADLASSSPALAPGLRDKLLTYSAAAMKLKHPQYLEIGYDIFEQCVDLAAQWSLKEIANAAAGKPYPPQSWWSHPLSWEAVMNGDFDPAADVHELEHGTTRLSAQWRTMMSRRSEQDEIWSFKSPPETWQSLGGRAGLVLVRRKTPIASVTLRMN